MKVCTDAIAALAAFNAIVTTASTTVTGGGLGACAGAGAGAGLGAGAGAGAGLGAGAGAGLGAGAESAYLIMSAVTTTKSCFWSSEVRVVLNKSPRIGIALRIGTPLT